MINNASQKWVWEQTLIIWNGVVSDSQTKNLKHFLIVTKSFFTPITKFQNFPNVSRTSLWNKPGCLRIFKQTILEIFYVLNNNFFDGQVASSYVPDNTDTFFFIFFRKLSQTFFLFFFFLSFSSSERFWFLSRDSFRSLSLCFW